MSFQTKDYVPVANDIGNIEETQVIGNKTDTAVVAVGVDKTLMAYTKGILNTVVALGTNQLDVAVYGPQTIDVNNTGHFEAMLTDRDTGLIAVGAITPGTYSIVRTRAGADTVIVAAGTAFSEATGRVYVDYTFAAANWATDDTFKLIPAGDTIVAIGGVNYYPAIPVFSGIVEDIGTIEGKVDTIDTNLDSLITTVGVAGAGLSAIPDMATNTDLDALIATVGVAGAGLSAIPDMATNTDVDALITTVGISGAGLTSIPAPAGMLVAADLSALALEVDLGDASGDTLTSVNAKLGDLATTVAAQLTTIAGSAADAAAHADPDAAGTLATAIAVPGADSAANTNCRDVIGDKTDTVAGDSLMAYAKNTLLGVVTVNNGVTGAVNAVNRLAGKTQIVNKAVAIAANAANTVLLTATTAAVFIKSLTVYAVAAQTADLTNLIVTGAAGDVVTFIDAVTGAQANLDAAGKQVAWTGACYLPAGATIDMDPTGTGATALNLIVSVEYMAAVNDGYLT